MISSRPEAFHTLEDMWDAICRLEKRLLEKQEKNRRRKLRMEPDPLESVQALFDSEGAEDTEPEDSTSAASTNAAERDTPEPDHDVIEAGAEINPTNAVCEPRPREGKSSVYTSWAEEMEKREESPERPQSAVYPLAPKTAVTQFAASREQPRYPREEPVRPISPSPRSLPARQKPKPTKLEHMPKCLRECTRVTETQQLQLEREAALYMDGRSDRGAWVMEGRTTGIVTQWDELHGYGFIEEHETEDEVFVNRRAVKRLDMPRWKHNLFVGEKVEFAKGLGRKGYWAVAVTRFHGPPASSDIMPLSQGASSREPVPVSLAQGPVVVTGDAHIRFTGGTYLIQCLPAGVATGPTESPRVFGREQDRSLPASYF